MDVGDLDQRGHGLRDLHARHASALATIRRCRALGDLERRLDQHQPRLEQGAGRRLTRDEAERAFPGVPISPWYDHEGRGEDVGVETGVLRMTRE